MISQEYERENGSPPLDMHRIAVLPFANISHNTDDDYFADGLTAELISKLSLVGGLRVIARTSTMKYKGSGKGITEIARELGCGVLVEGSVRKAGDKIRVTVQVVDANSEEHLWSSTYDNNLNDIFAIQDEISRNVSGSLHEFIPPARSSTHKVSDTTNLDAYTYYMKAQRLSNERTDASIKQALEFFTKAVQLDPNFARAYVGIGGCYPELVIRSILTYDEGVDAMKTAALRALEIDDNLAEAHSLMSYFAWGQDDFPTAEREARKAIELNPNLAGAHQSLGIVLSAKGYPQSALKLFETSYSLDPLSAAIARFLGLHLFYMGRDAASLELWNKNIKLAPFEMHLALAEYFLSKMELEKADEQVLELERLSSSDFNSLVYRAYIFAVKGDKESVQKIIKKLDNSFRGGAILDRAIGFIGYFFGDMDGFYRSMFRAVDQHVLDVSRMRYSPAYEKARKDPRYPALLRRNGLDPELKEPLY